MEKESRTRPTRRIELAVEIIAHIVSFWETFVDIIVLIVLCVFSGESPWSSSSAMVLMKLMCSLPLGVCPWEKRLVNVSAVLKYHRMGFNCDILIIANYEF